MNKMAEERIEQAKGFSVKILQVTIILSFLVLMLGGVSLIATAGEFTPLMGGTAELFVGLFGAIITAMKV